MEPNDQPPVPDDVPDATRNRVPGGLDIRWASASRYTTVTYPGGPWLPSRTTDHPAAEGDPQIIADRHDEGNGHEEGEQPVLAEETDRDGEGTQEPWAGCWLSDSRRKLAKASQRGDRERFLWYTR